MESSDSVAALTAQIALSACCSKGVVRSFIRTNNLSSEDVGEFFHVDVVDGDGVHHHGAGGAVNAPSSPSRPTRLLVRGFQCFEDYHDWPMSRVVDETRQLAKCQQQVENAEAQKLDLAVSVTIQHDQNTSDGVGANVECKQFELAP